MNGGLNGLRGHIANDGAECAMMLYTLGDVDNQ
jgi:hypothetical protein